MSVFKNWAVIGLLVIDLVLATIFVYGWVTWDPESGAVESIAAFVIAPLAISLAITALTIVGLLIYRYVEAKNAPHLTPATPSVLAPINSYRTKTPISGIERDRHVSIG